MSTYLKKESYEWAISHIGLCRDTDLFPSLKEFDILFLKASEFVDELTKIDIENYIWQPYRRFIIPKDELSYRVSMQLDPIDSLVFAAIIFEYGQLIEDKRFPIECRQVFSNRFFPTPQGQLYYKNNLWKNYWHTAREKSKKHPYIIYIDIDDFYNRIYHHILENQLIECGFPNQIKKSIKSLLQNTTQTVSQGIPVGNHASHLLAEMYLIPLDEGLRLKGFEFCRYMDDILIFTDNETSAKLIIYEMAKMLDSLKLSMQRQKTKIFTLEEFQNHCDKMESDDPINDIERDIVRIVEKHSTSPYQSIAYTSLSSEELNYLSEPNIKRILSEYLLEDNNYGRIRWFYRRLAQFGIETAISCTMENIKRLMPVINDIALYFTSVAGICENTLNEVGLNLLNLTNDPIVRSNEYLQLTIISLFSRTNKFNNITYLLNMYSSANECIKREIILSAYVANASSWIRDIRHEYNNMSIWSKRALIIASSLLPQDERKFFLQSLPDESNLTLNLLKKFVKAF